VSNIDAPTDRHIDSINREGLLWVDERPVAQQAITQRFSCLPTRLFERVWHDRPLQTHTRPLPPALP
jgi:hypothetical protein